MRAYSPLDAVPAPARQDARGSTILAPRGWLYLPSIGTANPDSDPDCLTLTVDCSAPQVVALRY
eukprot:443280-Prorocentrum_minimum.AAC.1